MTSTVTHYNVTQEPEVTELLRNAAQERMVQALNHYHRAVAAHENNKWCCTNSVSTEAHVTECAEAYWNAESYYHNLSEAQYEPEVTRVNDRYADTFWKGTTGTTDVKAVARRTDLIWTLDGYKLYPGWDRFGNRLITYWQNNRVNIRFRLSVQDNEQVVVEAYLDVYHEKWGKWYGEKIGQYKCGKYYQDVTEQRGTYWIAVNLSKLLTTHPLFN